MNAPWRVKVRYKHMPGKPLSITRGRRKVEEEDDDFLICEVCGTTDTSVVKSMGSELYMYRYLCYDCRKPRLTCSLKESIIHAATKWDRAHPSRYGFYNTRWPPKR